MQAHSTPRSSSRLRLPRLALLWLLGGLLSSCSLLSPGKMSRIHNTHWRLVAMDSEPYSLEGHILLRIGDGRQLFGQMKSSSYFGSYESGSNGGFRVLNLAPIQRGPSEGTAPEVLQYLGLILLVDHIGIESGGQLVFKAGKRELLRFEDSLKLRDARTPGN